MPQTERKPTAAKILGLGGERRRLPVSMRDEEDVLIMERNDPRKEIQTDEVTEFSDQEPIYTPSANDIDNESYVQKNEIVRTKLSTLGPSESQSSTVVSQSSLGSSDSAIPASKPAPRHQSSSSSASNKSSSSALVRRKATESNSGFLGTYAKAGLPSLATLFSLLFYILQFASKSSVIGYCDTNDSSNAILAARSQALVSARECVARHANGDAGPYGSVDGCDASALPLVPFLPGPTACTPCPAHAVCSDGELIACDKEYILSPSLLGSILPEGGSFLNGLPGLGSIAFPPSCVPDTERLRMVGDLAKAVEGTLAKERGEIICEAGKRRDENIEVYGISEADLRDQFLDRRDVRMMIISTGLPLIPLTDNTTLVARSSSSLPSALSSSSSRSSASLSMTWSSMEISHLACLMSKSSPDREISSGQS